MRRTSRVTAASLAEPAPNGSFVGAEIDGLPEPVRRYFSAAIAPRNPAGDGVTIPTAGRVGRFFGTDRWDDGVLFRYEINELELVTRSGGRAR